MVAESFLPQVNGVTNTVLRVLEHLRDTGQDAFVLAPADGHKTPKQYAGFPVTALPSVGLPGYADVRVVGATTYGLERTLSAEQPDVVHLASPFALGYKAALAAANLQLPSVAIYTTEIASYAARYGAPQIEPILWRRIVQAHSLATVNFAPSTFARDQLQSHGVPRVGIWGRGVDSIRFHPGKRDETMHDSWAPNGERVIGYVGRLASEKQVADLRVLGDIPRTRIVIVGDGPLRGELERLLPNAIFLGHQGGDELPRCLASFDLFVHTGELETFCQTIQEAHASGIAVVAPRRGGPIDLVDPSRTGWLYQPGDLAQMREQVIDLVGDDAKRQAMGRQARAAVAHKTWDFICAQLVEHYRNAIDVQSRRPRISDALG